MILTFGSLANSTPYLGGILLVIVLSWIGAARSLDSQFSPLAKQELEKEKLLKEKVKEPVVKPSQENKEGLVGKEATTKENGSLGSSASENSTNGSALKEKLAPESKSSSDAPTT